MPNSALLKAALDKRDWSFVQQALHNGTPGEALFVLSRLLSELDREEYQLVKGHQLASFIQHNDPLIKEWVRFMQSPDYALFPNFVLAHPSTRTLQRAAFVKNYRAQNERIKEWLRLEVAEFATQPVRQLLTLLA